MAKALRTAYLLAYNAACMLGWAYVLFLGASALAKGAPLTAVWAVTAAPLTIVQWAMCLEVVHAATGLVPSPLVPTFLQVLSRIVILVIATAVPGSQSTTAAGVAVLSWGLVEVPRYAFYVASLLGAVPYPLFYLRYSLFFVLYPSGILGEIGTARTAVHILTAARAGATFSAYGIALPAVAFAIFIKLLLVSYLPGGPFMYFNMVGNRKSAFAKRCVRGGKGHTVGYLLYRSTRPPRLRAALRRLSRRRRPRRALSSPSTPRAAARRRSRGRAPSPPRSAVRAQRTPPSA